MYGRMINMEDYTTSEKWLTYLMRIYSILFLVVGYGFLLFPWKLLEWLGLPRQVNAQPFDAVSEASLCSARTSEP